MNTIICAGGTSLRVMEAILHLCAAGFGPEKLRLLVIDPDGSNGNLSDLQSLVSSYIDCYKSFAGNVDPQYPFFSTELDLMSVDKNASSVPVWSPVKPKQNLKDVIQYNVLSPLLREVVDSLFTYDELNTELDQGFRGHPAIGSAAISMVDLKRDQHPWNLLAESIKQEVSTPDGSNVMIIGSVFGGTGAASLYPIARFLRTIPETNANRLNIGVAAIVPYFRFEKSKNSGSDNNDELAARAEWFAVATKSAVEFYQHLWEYEQEAIPFDSMMWIGNDAPIEVEYSKGGPTQNNPAHFIELMTAKAVLENLKKPMANKKCYYSGPEYTPGGDKLINLINWDDFPLLDTDSRQEFKYGLLRFFMTGFTHLGFFNDLLTMGKLDKEPFRVPWYYDRFAQRGDWMSNAEAQAQLKIITRFFKSFYLPWWKQISNLSTVHLFNKDSLLKGHNQELTADLKYLSNLLWPDEGGESDPDSFDKFFTDMIKTAKKSKGQSGVPTYWSLLALAADRFIDREYKKSND